MADVPSAERSNSSMLPLRIKLLMKQGSFDEALDLTKAFFAINDDPRSMYFATSTKEDLFWWMARQSIPYSHGPLLKALRARGVSDGWLASCVAFYRMYDGSAETRRLMIDLRDDIVHPITAAECDVMTADLAERESAIASARDVFAAQATAPLITDSIVARVAGIELDIRSGDPLPDDLVRRSSEVIRDGSEEGVPVWALYVVWLRLSGCITFLEGLHERRDLARDITSQLTPVLKRLSRAERLTYRASQRTALKEVRRVIKEL
jgi:hypothetical protein